jgi:hypothetical protein
VDNKKKKTTPAPDKIRCGLVKTKVQRTDDNCSYNPISYEAKVQRTEISPRLYGVGRDYKIPHHSPFTIFPTFAVSNQIIL